VIPLTPHTLVSMGGLVRQVKGRSTKAETDTPQLNLPTRGFKLTAWGQTKVRADYDWGWEMAAHGGRKDRGWRGEQVLILE
jgi:hypothetical protein